MHNYYSNYFTFIDEFNKEYLEKLHKKVHLIYRTKGDKFKLNTLKKLKFFCKTNKKKLFISNNLRLAKKINCDGIYISAHNKKLYKYDIDIKKKFKIIGSAHTINEICIKEKQGVSLIFLSPLFYSEKNKKYLDVSKFNLLSFRSKIKVIALGGINNSNIKKLKMIKCSGFAAISYFRNKN